MTTSEPIKELQARIRARIPELQIKALDILEQQMESLKTNTETPRLPLHVARRRLSNILNLWKFCHRARCSRSHCCKGEPNECLNACLFLLPHELLAEVLSNKQVREHIRQRVNEPP